jgi:starvation-inducible outer membrane lipoprotein
MKKIICVFVAAFALLLTGCESDASQEDLTRGIKITNPDIVAFQTINLNEPRDGDGSVKRVKCESKYDGFFADNTTWGVAKMQNQEVYLMKVARSVWRNDKTNQYTYAICHKQKLF